MTLWSSIPKPTTSAIFEDALKTLDLRPGRHDKNAVHCGWKDPIGDHDKAAKRVEEQMLKVKELRKDLHRLEQVEKNWETAWFVLHDEDPELFQEYATLKPMIANFTERLKLMKKTSERLQAEAQWTRYHTMKGRCERVFEAQKRCDKARKAKTDAFETMKAADQALEALREEEKAQAALVTMDHVMADDRKVHISELSFFRGARRTNSIVTKVNGIDVEDLPFNSILEILTKARKPQELHFTRYDFRCDAGIWRSVEEMEKLKKFVEDPVTLKENFVDACRKGNLALVRRFLDEGDDHDVLNDQTSCVGAHHAAANGHIAVLQELRRKKDKLFGQRDANNETPLFHAARRGQLTSVQYLIDLGVRLDLRDSSGRTIFSHAVQSRNLEVLDALVLAEPRLSVRDAPDRLWRWTPLHFAVSLDDVDVVAFLLHNDFSPYAVAKDGKEPIDLASPGSKVFDVLDSWLRAAPAQRIFTEESVELWAGSQEAAHPRFVRDRGFTAILSITTSVDDRSLVPVDDATTHKDTDSTTSSSDHDGPTRLVIPLSPTTTTGRPEDDDDETDDKRRWEEVVMHLEKATEFIDAGGGKTVLVHGRDDASCAMIVAYLMTKKGLRFEEALTKVQDRRRELEPGPYRRGLETMQDALDRKRLERYEKRLKESTVMLL